MIRAQRREQQEEFWIARDDLPRARAGRYYDKLEETLAAMDFTAHVHRLCAPFYSGGEGGRPPIDPVVYFKMLMVGFLENLPSERAIAARCGDSLMIRRFLGYDLSEETPEHSSFTVIRNRLGAEIFEAVFDLSLEGLRAHGLLRGKNLGIDSSVIEANASLRGLENRNTGEAYWAYVKRLAEEAGVDVRDAAAVRRFDRKRPGRRTSNEEWVNPHDPDAKVAKAKDGATDMLYKPQNVVDLDTGAVLHAQVRPADKADTEGLAECIVATAALVEAIRGKSMSEGEKRVPAATQTMTADSRAERDSLPQAARRAAPAGAGNATFRSANWRRFKRAQSKPSSAIPSATGGSTNWRRRNASPCSGRTARRAASMAKRSCGGAACTSNAALPTSWIVAACGARPCAGRSTSTSDTKLPRPLTTSPSSCGI